MFDLKRVLLLDCEILPKRTILGHVPPAFVRNHAWFFITICCQQKRINHLCVPETSSALLGDGIFCHTTQRWILNILLLMPDHLHLIAAFPGDEEMSTVIGNWKRLTARRAGVDWQRNYFDHRIRADEGLEQKTEYIRQNPVRAGLVKSPDRWPHFVDQRAF